MGLYRIAERAAPLVIVIGAFACTPMLSARAPLDVRPVSTPPNPDLPVDEGYYQSAVTAIEKRDYALALTYLQAARTNEPNSARVLNAFGVVYDKLGRFDLSARYYAQAKAADPQSTIVARNEAYSKVLQGLVNGDVTPQQLAQAAPPEPQPPAVVAPDAMPVVIAQIPEAKAAPIQIARTEAPAAAASESPKARAPGDVPSVAVQFERAITEARIDAPALAPAGLQNVAPEVTVPELPQADQHVPTTDTVNLTSPPTGIARLPQILPFTLPAVNSQPGDLQNAASDPILVEPSEVKPYELAAADVKSDYRSANFDFAPPPNLQQETRAPVQPRGEPVADREATAAVSGPSAMLTALQVVMLNDLAPRDLPQRPASERNSASPQKMQPVDAPAVVAQAPVRAAALPTTATTTHKPATEPLPRTLAALGPSPAAHAAISSATPNIPAVKLVHHALVIVNASAQKNGDAAIRRVLLRRNWSIARTRIVAPHMQAHTTLIYAQTDFAVAKALKRTLTVPVRLVPDRCECVGLRLVVGANALNRRYSELDDNPLMRSGYQVVGALGNKLGDHTW